MFVFMTYLIESIVGLIILGIFVKMVINHD